MTALVTSEPTPGGVVVPASGWTRVCRATDLERERGVAALVAGRQVALFRVWDGGVHALDHKDPVSGAYVMARGIVGSRGDVPTVASPMFKQVFDLRTGACLDNDAVQLRVHRVRIRDGVVYVALASDDREGTSDGIVPDGGPAG